jgi:hypothetical protein
VHYRVGTDGVDVNVWWWGDDAHYHAHAPHLAAELDAMAEAWQDAYVVADRNREGVRAWMR